MHRLLERQLKRVFGSAQAVPAGLAGLLAAVDQAYRQADEDRLLLERSLELTSQELLERNRDLREQLASFTQAKLEREASVALLRASEERYRRLFEEDLAAIVVSRPDGRIVDCNPAFAETFGFASVEDALGCDMTQLYRRPEDRRTLLDTLQRHGRVKDFETEAVRRDGQPLYVVANVVGRFDEAGRLAGILGFITDQTRRRELEDHLHQSQRIEALGRLAGGIAHDFNNLLTAILGYGEMLQAHLDPKGPSAGDVGEILRAGQRAADLTRQLLAFSRRQVIQPRRVQLNAVVATMEQMLRRLIPEDIELVTALAPDLGEVVADPGQLEQVIANLVVNARDAMPDGGTLVVETADVEVDEAYQRHHPIVAPGHYVLLTVSDSGAGIERHLLDRIFEPFFTTKEMGRGTGLGLSVVYGIVKQSGGYIWVYSEPGHGATFKVYLPRAEGHTATPGAGPEAALDVSGEETVLLVEDEAQVRGLADQILKSHGYRTLKAADGREALALARAFEGDIDLLVTDLVMPQMAGPSLAVEIAELRPAIKVLFMSGYSETAVTSGGKLRPGAAFLRKPFSARDLLGKVRDVLGG